MAQPTMSSGQITIALRAPEGEQQDNPFAPPPEGAPEQPWQPRRPEGTSEDGEDTPPPPPPPGWGGQWSNHQPGRQDGFGNRPSGPDSPPPPSGPRFDPTDPAQRRSRYALVCGGWGLIFSLFRWTEIALLLGALALYWGISALRMKPEDRAAARAEAAAALAESGANRPAPSAPASRRSFAAAAWSGIITSAVTLAIVAATFAFQFVYDDYVTCKRDALTTPSSEACIDLLPKPLRTFMGNDG
ncbi:hypothetical protein [Streptomyces sp. H39-S7]|uniref:hypothetical protein n=1 Tax=Streptomyces sp. H39-S7 TaxID=3004357 RepID=UPI0022AF457B|nr:hypothetical protein [Streptomyces sp. H39-S7]MCZ4120671.1 hypothetical protein [Streptomyces sp. H39-S7]